MNRQQFRKLNVTLTKEDYQQAELSSESYKTCTNFLKKHNNFYGGHTNFVNKGIGHDYYIWCIAINALKKHILTKHNIKIEMWEDEFNIEKIVNIINKITPAEEDIAYVHKYVCNKYHIKIADKAYDIRTLLTKYNPTTGWDFMFSANKTDMRKNDVVLLFCIGTKKHINKIVFIGTILNSVIRQCPILKKGQLTKAGVVSRINNYLTTLGKHYTY